MRNASAGLIAYLNSLSPTVQPYVADLLTIIQKNGTITRLTSAPVDVASTSQAISFSDVTVYNFLSGGVTFTRSRVKQVIGLTVDNLTLTLITDPLTQTLGGIPWSAAAQDGAFDGARFVLERAFMPTWGDTSNGTLIIFAGSAGEIQATRTSIGVTVVADINILERPMPRNVWQAGCLHNLYDAGCTLSQGAFTVTGVVVAGGTASAFRTNLTQADDYFALGAITFTSGVLSGQTVTVKAYANASGLVTPNVVLPSNPAAGVTFSIYPGCDKTQATCTNKFSNLAHFRGFPYIPVPETAG